MASPEPQAPPKIERETQVPAWEHENLASSSSTGEKAARPRTSTRQAVSRKLDSILPPHRRYLGMSRKALLFLLLFLLLGLPALIIGLALGLSSHKSGSQNLPLPSNSQEFVGDLTYYQAGLGACGQTDGQNANIVAVSYIVFDAAGSSSSTGGNSNDNPLCGKMLRASRYDSQYGQRRSVDLTVVDRCEGCQADDIDTTIGAFEKLAPSAAGRVDVTWAWLEPVATGK